MTSFIRKRYKENNTNLSKCIKRSRRLKSLPLYNKVLDESSKTMFSNSLRIVSK